MNYIKSNNWYVRENNLSISLMNFHVEIEGVIRNNILSYNLIVVQSEKVIKEKSFMFKNLEDAITFTEDVIAECWTLSEINDEYNKIYNSYGDRKVKKKSLWS